MYDSVYGILSEFLCVWHFIIVDNLPSCECSVPVSCENALSLKRVNKKRK